MGYNYRWQYPSKIEPISQAGETITLDKWYQPVSTPRSPLRKLPIAILAGSLFFVNLGQPEASTPDKWLPSKPDIIFSRPQNQFLYPSFFGVNLHEIPGVESITLDKWYFEHQPNPWRPKLHASRIPYFFFHPGKEALEAGIRFEYVQRPDQVFRKHKRAHYMRPEFFDPLPIPPVVETTLDMWFSESLLFNPVLPRKRPWTYLFYSRDVVLITGPTPPAPSRFNVISSRGNKNVIHQDSKTINQYQQ